MKSQLIKEFKNPSNKFRGKPFWSWNGELKKEELLRQIDALRDMGFGGYFMHSRVGLETEYLGDEWFDLINACADYGYAQGLESYLYDEDRWPSGIAGGLVTKNPEYRQRFLTVKLFQASEFKWEHNFIAVFALDLFPQPGTNGYGYTKSVRLNPYSQLSGEETVAAFYVKQAPSDPFCNGYTYVDAMNPEAIGAFLKCTHDKYVEKCGDRIGTKIKAIFTDEPHRGQLFVKHGCGCEHTVPYTPGLFDEYQERFSESLMDKLPELFFFKNGNEISPVKWKYVELLQELFIEGFFIPVEKWCSDHNIALTGHALHEDSFSCQTAYAGSMMRIYPHMHMPGVDTLGSNHKYWIVKQLASAARQTGKETLLSELYGCIGWQLDFTKIKSVGDWQSLFGVNLRCPHLSWYTMKGEGKRDYPASIHYQSAWYKDYKFVEDYYARMHTILAAGKPECELLVINPLESMWAGVHMNMLASGFNPTSEHLTELEKKYADTFMALAGNRIDFDYGDEGLMAEMASVTKGGLLKIGKCKYKKVLVTGADTLRSTTMRVLERFAKQGGEIFFADEVPGFVDSEPSQRVKELAEKCKCIAFKDIPIACASGKEITVENNSGITHLFAQTRTNGKERYAVIINTAYEDNCRTDYGTLTLCLGEGVGVSELNLRNGSIQPVDYRIQNGKVYVDADFPPTAEHAYLITTAAETPKPALKKNLQTITPGTEYSYSLSEKNIYVMDGCCYRINGGRWSSYFINTLDANKHMRDKLNMERRGTETLQPWFIKKFHPEKLAPVADVDVRYTFYIKNKPKKPIELVIEGADEFTVKINGVDIDTEGSLGKWVDVCYDRFTIPADCIKTGKNEVILSTHYGMLSSIEPAFVIGDFGVIIPDGKRPYITKLPSKLHIGDITTQGLPFYSGEVTYKVEIKELRGKKAEIHIPSYKGALSKVSSGKKTEMTCWMPNKADITGLVTRSGKLNITVGLSRCNTFGIHTFPSLHGHPGSLTEEYQLEKHGLMQSPEITIYE